MRNDPVHPDFITANEACADALYAAVDSHDGQVQDIPAAAYPLPTDPQKLLTRKV
jgi:hypothetical protein